jgi:hypothetical protein
MTETSFDTVYALGDYFFVSGSTQELFFNCYDDTGAILNITGATCSLKVSPLGQPSVESLNKSGTITDAINGIFKVELLASDTLGWVGGKYVLQPIIVDFSGKTFKPSQGIWTIVEGIV